MARFFKDHNWTHLFYLFSAWRVTMGFPQLREQLIFLEKAQWQPPMQWLVQAKLMDPVSIYVSAGPAVSVTFGLLAIFPFRFSGFIAAFFWSFWISLLHPFSIVGHGDHGAFLIAFGIGLGSVQRNHDSRSAFQLALAAMGSMYGASGIWKLRGLIAAKDPWAALSTNLPNQIAYGQAENFVPHREALLEFFNNHEWLSGAIWMGVTSLQIAVPCIWILSRFWRVPFLIVMVLFHLSSAWMIGPAFQGQVFLLLFLTIPAIESMIPMWKLKKRL